VVPIPVLVAVVGDIPPPDKLAVDSVQTVKIDGKEELVDMKQLKISWQPYIPEGFPKGKDDTEINFMHCKMRGAIRKNMKEETLIRYDYLLPHFQRPSELLQDPEEPTVRVFKLVEGVGLHVDFNWQHDSLSEVVENAVDDHSVLESSSNRDKHIEEVKKEVKQAVIEEKKKREEKNKDRKAIYDKMDETYRTAMEDIKTYKFYPQNKKPNISNFQAPLVNRYYGFADAVFPQVTAKMGFQLLLPAN
jgi:hypothetical protein